MTTIMPGSINTLLFDKALTKLGVKPAAPPPFQATVPNTRVRGDFSRVAFTRSAYNWLETHPLARGLAAVAIVGVLAALAALVMRRGD